MKKLLLTYTAIILATAFVLTYACKKETAPGLPPTGHYNTTPKVSEQIISNIEQTKGSIQFAKKAVSPIKFAKQVNYPDDDIPYCIFVFFSTFTINTTVVVEYTFTNSVGATAHKYAYMIFGTWVIKGVTYPFSGQIANCPDECELGAAVGTTVNCTFYTSDGLTLLGEDSFKVKPIN